MKALEGLFAPFAEADVIGRDGEHAPYFQPAAKCFEPAAVRAQSVNEKSRSAAFGSSAPGSARDWRGRALSIASGDLNGGCSRSQIYISGHIARYYNFDESHICTIC